MRVRYAFIQWNVKNIMLFLGEQFLTIEKKSKDHRRKGFKHVFLQLQCNDSIVLMIIFSFLIKLAQV